MAVVLFHLDLLPGGWLGVDLFFVLSGFLITRLLVHERAHTGDTDLIAFWKRRGRRLLPAVVMVMVGVAIFATWFPEPSALPANLPMQMVASVLYFANWHNIFSGGNYWDQFAVESPLRHMWSLSIEEQFYVIFPVVMTALFAAIRRRRNIAGFLMAGAITSWAVGIVLLATGHSFERVYLGTDTRIGAVLLGAAAGYLSCDPTIRVRLTRWARRASIPALAIVAVLITMLDGTVNWSPHRWMLLPLFEFGVVILLFAPIDQQATVVSRLVENRVLCWLGTISYGLYLWHVPIMLAVQRAFINSPRPVVIIVTVGVSVVVSQASYSLIERPIRVHGLSIGPRFSVVSVGAALLALSMWATVTATKPARDHWNSSRSTQPRTDIVDANSSESTGSSPDSTPKNTGSSDPDAVSNSTQSTATATSTTTTTPQELPLMRPDGRDPRILLIGDSIAYDLTDAFKSQGGPLGYTASASSLVGCGLGGIRFDPNDDQSLTGRKPVQRCEQWMSGWGELVGRSAPDVVILARFSYRQPEPGVSTCDPANLESLEKSLRNDIATLGSNGTTVAVTSMLYGRFGATRSTEADDVTDCVNARIRDVTNELPSAVELRLNEWVCPSRDDCRVTQDGVTLRPDGLHFQGQGAVIATDWMIRQLYG